MSKQLVRTFYQRLDEPARKAVEQAVTLAEARGLDLYLVGGAVRDLLLDAGHVDIDLVMEGDAIAFGKRLARRLDARVTAHARFGTATVTGAGYRIDLAGARSERYPRPGALPVVTLGSLSDDVARRDFTINAMALRLTGRGVGRLIDKHGGQDDLRAGRVRVLHDRSFQDDPTRMLRAVRYAGRLSFRMEQGTDAALRRDLPYLSSISGTRLRHELERIAIEERAAEIISLGGTLGVLSNIISLVWVSDRIISAITKIQPDSPHSSREAIVLCMLLAFESTRQTEAGISRLSLTGRQAGAVRSFEKLRAGQERLGRPGLRPSEVVALLSDKPVDAIEALALYTDDAVVRDRLRKYIDTWRHVRTRLNGSDIEALGVRRGPEIGAALDALLVARVDGVVSTRDEEVAFVEKFRGRTPIRASRG